MNAHPMSKEIHLLSTVNGSSPTVLVLVLALALMALGIFLTLFNFIRSDYQAAVARGSGGTPASFLGYLEISFFRLFRIRNTRVAPEISPRLRMQRGYLESLPMRNGVRPKIVGMAPQRQITQIGSKEMYNALSKIIIDFSRANETNYYLGRSTFKNNNTALFARTTGYSHTKYHGEICHAHPNDGSMHLNLHPADVKAVIEAGWGERHPLARSNWYWNLICPIPAGLTLVYSPREEKELDVMNSVVRAAAWWISGADASIEESWI